VELSSIGVHPDYTNHGLGSILITEFVKRQNFSEINYIRLTTDAINNEAANAFYIKNGFQLYSTYFTPEGRKMNEYRYKGKG
ncbi:TPA: GNAT family N-acetyltransferase, partial [Streptococcus suis]